MKTDTQDQGEGHVKMKEEIEVMLPQTKEHQEPPEAEVARKDSSGSMMMPAP